MAQELDEIAWLGIREIWRQFRKCGNGRRYNRKARAAASQADPRASKLPADTTLHPPVERPSAFITTTKTTKLSQRPLRRQIVFEIMLRPYSVAYRDGKERPRQHYMIWISELPRGNKHRRLELKKENNLPILNRKDGVAKW